ncbi:MAG: SRPBCC family protein [Parvularculaceae bacterium]
MHSARNLSAVAFLCLSACGKPEIIDGAVIAAGDNSAFQHERQTSAPPDAIWALWTDASTWKDWDKGLKSARLEGPMAAGAIGEIAPLSGPTAQFRVTDYIEGQSYSFETSLPLARLTVRRSFVSLSPTVFRHDVSFSGALGGFWSDRLGPQFRAALPATMDALATLAEQSGDVVLAE